MKKETLDNIELWLGNFMGDWFYADIDEENRVTKLILFPLVIITMTIGIVPLLLIFLFRSAIYPDDYKNY